MNKIAIIEHSNQYNGYPSDLDIYEYIDWYTFNPKEDKVYDDLSEHYDLVLKVIGGKEVAAAAQHGLNELDLSRDGLVHLIADGKVIATIPDLKDLTTDEVLNIFAKAWEDLK